MEITTLRSLYNKKMCKILLTFLLSFILLGSTVISLHAASPGSKVYELRLASPMPPKHFMHTQIWDWWGAELNKRTNGRVKVNSYAAGALGNAMVIWENTLNGIADIGAVGAYTPAKFPVMDLPQWMPFRIPNFVAQNHISWHLYHTGLIDTDIKKFKFLFPCDPGPVLLCTSKKKVTKLDDIKGLRIRVLGSCPSLERLGADTVGMPLGEVHTALERGMIDGLLTGPSVIPAAKLDGIIKYINLAQFACGGWYTLMNLDVWNNFPPDIQYIIDKLNMDTFYSQVLPSIYKFDVMEGVEKCKAAGIDFYSPEPKELEKWKEATADLADDWIKSYEAKGLPGKKVVEEVQNVLGMYGEGYTGN